MTDSVLPVMFRLSVDASAPLVAPVNSALRVEPADRVAAPVTLSVPATPAAPGATVTPLEKLTPAAPALSVPRPETTVGVVPLFTVTPLTPSSAPASTCRLWAHVLEAGRATSMPLALLFAAGRPTGT